MKSLWLVLMMLLSGAASAQSLEIEQSVAKLLGVSGELATLDGEYERMYEHFLDWVLMDGACRAVVSSDGKGRFAVSLYAPGVKAHNLTYTHGADAYIEYALPEIKRLDADQVIAKTEYRVKINGITGWNALATWREKTVVTVQITTRNSAGVNSQMQCRFTK